MLIRKETILKSSRALGLAAGLTVLVTAAQAQFLKKLKNTVKEVAGTALSGDAAGGDAAQPGPGSDIPQGGKLSVSGLEQQGVTVVHAGSAAFLKGEYFIEDHSGVAVRDTMITATVVVGVMTKAESLSEAGMGSEKDAAYIFENGKKSQETTVGGLDKALVDASRRYDYPWTVELSPGNDKEYDRYVSGDAAGSLRISIHFNGKTYGPYMAVNKLYVDKTRSKFYAIVLPDAENASRMNYLLVSGQGKSRSIGLASDILFNRDLDHPCLLLPAGYEEMAALSKITDDTQREQLQQQMTRQMMEHSGEGSTVFENGKMLKDIPINDPWLDLSGNNLFSIMVESGSNKQPAGLYLNGKKISDEAPSPGQGWCNAAASAWAFLGGGAGQGNYLIFSDGTDIKSPLHPRQLVVNGRSYMTWFMYDRGKSDEILLCSKPL
ncbi:hypothetical protein [Compostibacter hankyongensis]|uniref:Uncharacterized protein n=1 Tax=Compostibacter hankyongensis TaxID=1007089 RepID=A0ABP8G7H7_9BACT